MTRILELPELLWVGGSYPWELQSRLVFQSDEAGTIIVPAHYRTDLASVPRIPGIHAWTGGRANMPAVIHDYLYDCCTAYMTRRQADRAFLEAMRAIREPRRAPTRWAMYLGVRLGGWRSWRIDSTDKCKVRDGKGQ